jgi:pyruvate/2-oxoglutarate dehydrogenase complex dihydrolipoamide acyltransferase (E2) component
VDTEIPSPVAGVLLEINAQEDDVIEVGGQLALVGEPSDATGDLRVARPRPFHLRRPTWPSGGRHQVTGTTRRSGTLSVRALPDRAQFPGSTDRQSVGFLPAATFRCATGNPCTTRRLRAPAESATCGRSTKSGQPRPVLHRPLFHRRRSGPLSPAWPPPGDDRASPPTHPGGPRAATTRRFKPPAAVPPASHALRSRLASAADGGRVGSASARASPRHRHPVASKVGDTVAVDELPLSQHQTGLKSRPRRRCRVKFGSPRTR